MSDNIISLDETVVKRILIYLLWSTHIDCQYFKQNSTFDIVPVSLKISSVLFGSCIEDHPCRILLENELSLHCDKWCYFVMDNIVVLSDLSQNHKYLSAWLKIWQSLSHQSCNRLFSHLTVVLKKKIRLERKYYFICWLLAELDKLLTIHWLCLQCFLLRFICFD